METNKNDSQAIQTDPSAPEPTGLLAKIKHAKKLLVIVAVVILLLIAGIVYAFTKKSSNTNTDTRNTRGSSRTSDTSKSAAGSAFMQQYGQGCKSRNVTFSSAPMKMDDLAYIRPLGAVSDGHVTPTDHVYIGPPNPAAADNTYPVLIPADGIITDVSAMPAQYIGDRAGQKVAPEDHRIVISHSCRYFSIYIHIHKLSDKLQAAVGTLQPNESKKANLELKAGEVVGYIGGSTFDWTPIDTSKRLKGFITPSLYEGESWKIHTVSPFDLYTGDLKSQLEAKSLRSVAPLGGKIDYDQPGKLIGNWFRQGTKGYSGESGSGRYWDGHLSIAPDYIDPTSTVVSIGNWMGSAKQFVVSGSVDPSRVTVGDGLVKYELKRLNYVTDSGGSTGNNPTKGMHPSQDSELEGTIALQVLTGEKLKVETFPGKTSSAVQGFTSAAQTYDR